MIFRRRKRCPDRGLKLKLDIVIDFATVTRKRESDAGSRGVILEELAGSRPKRMGISVEFLKWLHSLEDARG
jgi:hypothetical protein